MRVGTAAAPVAAVVAEPVAAEAPATRAPVFIIGCPRSGTTWVSELLARHPSMQLFQHSKLFHYLSGLVYWWNTRDAPWAYSAFQELGGEAAGAPDAGNPPRRQLLTLPMVHRLCRDVAQRVFDEVARAKPGARVVVDKTPENARLARLIQNVFPDARFLHIVRDPRAVVSSLRAAGRTWAKGEFPTRPIDGARYWQGWVRLAAKAEKSASDYRLVRYEDLWNDPPRVLGELLAWLGEDSTPELCEQAVEACQIDRLRKKGKMPDGFFRRGVKDGWRSELSKRDVALIECAAADTMAQFSYQPETRPSGAVRLRVRVHDACDRAVRRQDKRLRRFLWRLRSRWQGRAPATPEWVLW